MLKKEITFENLDGESVTQTFYFNLDRAEMLEMELRFGDKGLEEHFKQVVATDDRGAILDLYKYILSSTVGRREGNLFIKTQQVRDEFMHSGAYSQMFIELFNNPTGILEFFRGVLPNNLRARYDQVMAEQNPTTKPALTPEPTTEQTSGWPQLPTTTVEVPIDEAPGSTFLTPTEQRQVATASLPPGGDGNVVHHTDDVKITPADEERMMAEMFPPEDKPKAWNDYTREELLALSSDDFKRLLGKDKNNVPRGLLNVAFERRSKGIDK